jgi:hypothetical protein
VAHRRTSIADRTPPIRAARLRATFASCLAAGPLAAAAAFSGPPALAALPERSERIVAYRIEAALDHAARTVRGRETVTWRNTTPETVGELQFHLYLNAFKNEKTTFMKESRGSHRGYRVRDGGWGYIDVESLRLAGGADLLPAASFIQPDDGNPDDETVLRVALPEPVPPGGEATVEIAFASRLPRVFARTGYKSDFYLVGQWFPKLGVYEPAGFRGRAEGGWNCHQFHANSEFYANFGAYDVTITVPSSFVVGATGKMAGPPRASPDGTATYRFVAEDVHDFAWTADPDFVEEVRTFSYAAERDPDEERRMARILGLDGSRIPPAGAADLSGVPEDLRLTDVEVKVLLHPEHVAQMDRHFRAAFNAIKYFGYWYGRYPYRTLTVVDPAYGGSGAGGMEYPNLITAGTAYVAPARRHSPESVTIHEFGHQFWYGLVASNEFEEAWLDEGLNTYSTGHVLDRAYGPNHDVMKIAGIPFVRFVPFEIPADPDPTTEEAGGGSKLTRALYLRPFGASNDALLNAFRDLPFLSFEGEVPVSEPWGRRRRYLADAPSSDEMLRAAWDVYDASSYWVNAYDKPALTVRTLEAVIGGDAVARALRAIHERHRFRHPSSDDFVAAVSESAGSDLRWYFDQTVRGSDLLDYAVAEAKVEEPKEAAGVFGPPGSRRTVTRDEARAGRPAGGNGAEHAYDVKVRRLGEVRLPVRIELAFEDGGKDVRTWDGQYRWIRIRGKAESKLVAARVLGPAGEDGFPLDANWSNDARAVTKDRWPALKWWTRLVAWAQNVLFFYSGIA